MSDDLRKKIIGLGESSFKKSYFPELQKRNKEFELFKRIFEITNDIIAIISIRNLEFKAVNKAFCNFFNIDESNFQSHKPIDVFGKDYFKLIMDQNVKQSKYLHELHIHEKVFFVEAEVSIIEQEGENFLINIIRDRTEHLTAQKNLEDLNNKIIEQNLELQNRNKQIASINKDLIKAKEKAEESDRLKTAFLQNMSHEIRTPMNGIFGFAELIKEPGILKEDIAKFADTIFSAAKQLLSVVDNIINISTITTGQEKVNYTMVDLDSFFSDLVLLFKNIAEEKGITIMEPDYIPLKPLWTDEVKLKQIFINLIGNAIKYSDHGQIILDIEEKVGYLKMSVSDNGSGIPEDMHDVIFERFRQVDTEGSRKMGGTGLGLAICKGYVSLLGGEINLKSKINAGSTFYFTHPKLNEPEGISSKF